MSDRASGPRNSLHPGKGAPFVVRQRRAAVNGGRPQGRHVRPAKRGGRACRPPPLCKRLDQPNMSEVIPAYQPSDSSYVTLRRAASSPVWLMKLETEAIFSGVGS